jgi:hypothetical protein
LSSEIRLAWDGGKLAKLTRHSPIKASNPHISVIGHITADELRARLTRTDMANGFCNRFLFCMVRRSKLLPFGGHLSEDEIHGLGDRTIAAVNAARTVERVQMTDQACEHWARIYEELSDGKPGLYGAITARAEAQVVRLALTYALLDGAKAIDLPHLKAALAVWDYAEASAAYVFGDTVGDPVADEILRTLRQAESGLTRTFIHGMFGRHKSADGISAALGILIRAGRIRSGSVTTKGRPAEIYFAVEH